MMKKMCLVFSLGFVYASTFAGIDKIKKLSEIIAELKKVQCIKQADDQTCLCIDSNNLVSRYESDEFTLYSNESYNANLMKDSKNLYVSQCKNGLLQVYTGDMAQNILKQLKMKYQEQEEAKDSCKNSG